MIQTLKKIIYISMWCISSMLFSQTTRYVNSSTGSDANAGTLAAPYKTFYKAYTVAASGDIINLTGTFDWTASDEIGDAATSGYTISKNLTIQGQSAQSTIIQAASTSNTADRRIFTLTNGFNLSISNITIQNGKTSNGGAFNIGGSSSSITLNNCEVINNYSTNNYGGAIYANYGSLVANSSTFSGNYVSAWGAVLYSYYGVFTFTNCTIASNTGASILHTIFGSGNINLTNNTIANNTISSSTYAVYIETSGYLLYFQNNMIVQNKNAGTARDLTTGGSVMSNVKNNVVEMTGTGINNGTNGNIVGANLFGISSTLSLNGSSTTRTLSISCSSVAVNAGITTANGNINVPALDQRENSRNGLTDIGAFENTGGSDMSYSGTLTAFSKCGSSTSSNQSFTVQGCNLTNNIDIAAPLGFEISTNASTGFTNSLTLTQSGGSVASTTVYVRMTAASTGAYSDNISLTSTGATSINIAVSGTAGALTVGTTSANQTVCYNTSASDIVLNGSIGTIQWQSSTDNSTWTNISGAIAATLTSAQIGTITTTKYYRAVVTSGSCSGNSSVVVLNVNNALVFDGSGDFVNIGNHATLNFTSNFTIETWLYVPSTPKASINVIFSKNYPNLGTPGYMFGFNDWNTSDLLLVFEPAQSAFSSTRPISAGKWNHVAAVVSGNGTILTFYINGKAAGTNSISLVDASSINEFIGSMDVSGSYSLQGTLDELRIWNTARTEQELINNMDNSLVGNETGLLAYYDFNQGVPSGTNTGLTIKDRTANAINGTVSGISLSGATSNFVDGNHACIISGDNACINGNSAKLIVGATGKTPSAFQWYKNTTNSTTGATAIIGATNQIFNTDSAESSTKYYYATISGTCASSSNSNIISLQNPNITGTKDVYEDNTTQLSCSDIAAASSPWVSLNTGIFTTSSSGLVTGIYPGSSKLIYTTSAGCQDTVLITVHPTEWNGNMSNTFGNGSNWKLNTTPNTIKKIRFNSSATNNMIISAHTQVDTIDFANSNKKLELGNYDLTVSNIKNYNSANYIKMTGTGKVKKAIANTSSFVFPIGNTSYNPVSITNKTGGTDSFFVNLIDTVYLNGTVSGPLTNARVNRTWNVSKKNANAGSGIDLAFTWNPSDLIGILTTPTLNHHTGSKWEIPSMGTSSISGTTLTYIGYTGTFSPFAIGGSSTVALPIELISFQATCHSEHILLDWSTASEKNNDRFEIYKSNNAIDWQIIGTQRGAGTTAERHSYSYYDQAPLETTYYRLKNIDFDGSTHWSNTIVSKCNISSSKTLVYPNPVEDFVFLSTPFEEGMTYELYDTKGHLIQNQKLTSSKSLLDFRELSSGVYIVKLFKMSGVELFKVVK